MSDTSQLIRRATRYAALTIGSGVALTLAMSSSAAADEVVVQDAEVTNTGEGYANSGGNTAVGNASQNSASSDQEASGLIASNQGTASNHSDGTASVTTGAATASGNTSSTQVSQQADGGSGGGGLTLAVQESDVTNDGYAEANSGDNTATGNASDNTATSDQTANGGAIGANSGGASNVSDGTAAISTGPATAHGNVSSTAVHQAAAADNGTGLAVLVQDTDVLNLGVAVANSGGNLALGNGSTNSASSTQTASGLIAANNGSATNASNGSAAIRTGAANAAGNTSVTGIGQAIHADPAGLTVALQSAPVTNSGTATAGSGLNDATGNDSLNQAIIAQVSFGLLASNIGGAESWSNGFAAILTGTATAAGNQSVTTVKQTI